MSQLTHSRTGEGRTGLRIWTGSDSPNQSQSPRSSRLWSACHGRKPSPEDPSPEGGSRWARTSCNGNRSTEAFTLRAVPWCSVYWECSYPYWCKKNNPEGEDGGTTGHQRALHSLPSMRLAPQYSMSSWKKFAPPQTWVMCLGWREDVRSSFPMFKEHQDSLDFSAATFSLLKPQLCHTVNLRWVRCQKAPR